MKFFSAAETVIKMLEVKPVENKSEQERICGLCGTVFIPDALAYAAYEDGILIGSSQFSVKADGGEMYDIHCVLDAEEDTGALFILGRAVLNFIDLCDSGCAYFKGKINSENEERLIRLIGFRKSDNGYSVDLKNFFDHPCRHDNCYTQDNQA